MKGRGGRFRTGSGRNVPAAGRPACTALSLVEFLRNASIEGVELDVSRRRESGGGQLPGLEDEK